MLQKHLPEATLAPATDDEVIVVVDIVVGDVVGVVVTAVEDANTSISSTQK